jgi:diguanylate cyclase (GGDEF)-like protein
MERIARDIRRQIRREDIFRRMIRALCGAETLENGLARALAGLARLVTFDAFELAFPETGGASGWISLRADRESITGRGGFRRRRVDHPGHTEGPAARALLLRGPISADRYGNGGGDRLPEGYDASLTLPLLNGSEIAGLMSFCSRRSGNFSHGDVTLLQQFSDLVTLALVRQLASDNLGQGGEAARLLGQRLPAVSSCSRSTRYLADLGGVLHDVFGLDGYRLYQVRREAGSIELVERFHGTADNGPALVDGRRIGLPRFMVTVMATGEIRVLEQGRDADPLARLIVRQGVDAETVMVPLRVEGQPAWVFTARGDLAPLGEQGSLSLLRLLQNMVEQALSGMAVYREAKSDAARLTGLLSLARIFSDLSPDSDVFHVVIDKLGELIDFDGCTLYLLDGDGPDLVPMVSNEPESEAAAGSGTRRRQWLDSVLEGGEARMIEEEDDGPTGQLIASPLLHKGRPFGAFCLQRHGRPSFGPGDLSLLSTLAGFTADAMHRSLDQQKQKDLRRTMGLLDQHAGEGIIFLDGRLRVTRAGREAQRLLGGTTADLLGRGLSRHLFRNRAELEGLVADLEADRPVRDFRTYAQPASEAPVPVTVAAALQDRSAGAAGGLLLVVRDVTEQLQLERRLEEVSVTDPLTGLRNRHEAFPALEAELERGHKRDRFLSAMLLRIRGLDRYNARQGWLAGDRLVRKISRIVCKRIRGHLDAAYRFGDGLFLVLMPDTPSQDAEPAARRIVDSVAGTFHGKVRLDAALTQSRFADTPDTVLQRLFARLDSTETVG